MTFVLLFVLFGCSFVFVIFVLGVCGMGEGSGVLGRGVFVFVVLDGVMEIAHSVGYIFLKTFVFCWTG